MGDENFCPILDGDLIDACFLTPAAALRPAGWPLSFQSFVRSSVRPFVRSLWHDRIDSCVGGSEQGDAVADAVLAYGNVTANVVAAAMLSKDIAVSLKLHAVVCM